MLDLAGTHRDGELYADPDRYDAWRFSREREAHEARVAAAGVEGGAERRRRGSVGGDPEEAVKIKRLGMVTTSPEYLPFSHGRHAW
jgi:cytochrome P450